MFKRRVGGVYFAIITQALAAASDPRIVGHQGLTGGPQRHHRLHATSWAGSSGRTPATIHALLSFAVGSLFGCHLAVPLAVQQARPHPDRGARQGRPRSLSSATTRPRSKRSSSASRPAIAGPSRRAVRADRRHRLAGVLGIVPSIEMVISVALGGRATLVGAVVGALIVNWAKTGLEEQFPILLELLHGPALHRRDRLPPRRGRWSPTNARGHEGSRRRRNGPGITEAGPPATRRRRRMSVPRG